MSSGAMKLPVTPLAEDPHVGMEQTPSLTIKNKREIHRAVTGVVQGRGLYRLHIQQHGMLFLPHGIVHTLSREGRTKDFSGAWALRR